MKINESHVLKFIELCDQGLSKGLGEQEPGKMCVEACWNAALGLPHGDDPPCVGKAVRAAKIALNDADWSSDMARAEGVRVIGVAQAGSDQRDQVEFTRIIAEGLERIKVQYPPADTAYAASYTADAASYTAYAASCTAEAARYTAYAASCTAEAARCTAEAARCTATAARCTADAARYTAYAASCTAYAAIAPNDEVLKAFADVILDALKQVKSPGCEYLHLLNR